MMNEHEAERARDESREREVERAGIRPEHALETVTNVAREHPHAALAGACAVGFLLGGGLTPKLLGAVGMLAARRYLQATLRETLDELVRDAKLGSV